MEIQLVQLNADRTVVLPTRDFLLLLPWACRNSEAHREALMAQVARQREGLV